jgi:putative oxidoreductase
MQHSAAQRYALLPLRIIVGFGFAYHGYAKLARGPDQFASILTALGVPMPELAAWLTVLFELLGGVAIMLGSFVAPLSVPLIVIMLVATFGVHLRYGFSSIRLQGITGSGAVFGPVGYEINLLYIGGVLTLALSREHALSFERWIRNHLSRSSGVERRPAHEPS